MKFTKILSAIALLAVVSFSGCKPKDADIQKAIEAKIAATPDMAGTKAEVKDGVATLSGECKDDACKAMCEKEIAGIKGVKSVVNNCSVKPAAEAPASMTTSSLAADVQQKVKDGLKDIKGIVIGGFTAKGVILNGEISAADNMKIKQMLAAAKVMLDTTSKLIIKK